MKRRNFLKTALPAVAVPFFNNQLWAAPFETSLVTSAMLNSSTSDRVLIIVQLNGGNDGLNMVFPIDQYANLQSIRANMILPENTILPLPTSTLTGLHPSMTLMQGLFNDGKASLIQSVGYPTQNFSHFRSMDIWTSASNANEVLETGWVGRYLSYLHPDYPVGYPNVGAPDPLAVRIGSSLTPAMQGYAVNMGQTVPSNFSGSLTQLIPQTYNSPAPATAAGDELSFIRTQQAAANAYSSAIITAYQSSTSMVTYPATPTQGGGYYPQGIGQQLRLVARLIKGGLKTKVYFVSMGGFDTHSTQTDATDRTKGVHANLLKELSDAIGTFQQDIKLMGIEDRVLGMTFSEFGRRVDSNASGGTDHGVASPMFLFGKHVNSGIIGTNPIIPATGTNKQVSMQYDFRSIYNAILQQWFLLSTTETSTVLLNTPTPITAISQAALPVELAVFEAQIRNENDVHLKWTTLSEQNTERFDIQRSTDGVFFTTVGSAKAQGTTLATSRYEFTDPKVPTKDRTYHYRLKVKDLDGSFKISETKIVTLEITSEMRVEVYPNPTKGHFYLHFEGFMQAKYPVEVNIVNIQGRSVYENSFAQVQTGSAMPISLEHLARGVYIIIIKHATRSITQKVTLV